MLESLRVAGGTVAGHDGRFSVRAADSGAAVSGLVLSLEGDSFGSSACRAARPSGRVRAPFTKGSPVVLSALHRFGEAGLREGVARVDAGSCDRVTGSVLQPFTATVTEPGQPPQPLLLGTLVPLLDAPVDVLEIPGVLDLPPLAPLDAPLQTVAAAPRCEGARSQIGRSAASRARVETAVRCLMNRQRDRRGLRPLGEDDRLVEAAEAHSRAMIRGGFFSHSGTNPPGRMLADRLRGSRYLPAPRFQVGENIAYGSGSRGTPASIVQLWMHSTPHRANILARSFREVGVGIEPGSPAAANRGATYTADFGVRR